MASVTRKPQAKRQERREQIERRLLDATERLMRDGASFTELSVDRLSKCSPISPKAPNGGGVWRGDTIPMTSAPGWPPSSPATGDINRCWWH